MIPIPEPVAPGQESIWLFPRPAIAEPTCARVVIVHAGTIVADIPPTDKLFVQRKISGTALLAARLRAQVDIRAKVAAILEEQQ